MIIIIIYDENCHDCNHCTYTHESRPIIRVSKIMIRMIIMIMVMMIIWIWQFIFFVRSLRQWQRRAMFATLEQVSLLDNLWCYWTAVYVIFIDMDLFILICYFSTRNWVIEEAKKYCFFKTIFGSIGNKNLTHSTILWLYVGAYVQLCWFYSGSKLNEQHFFAREEFITLHFVCTQLAFWSYKILCCQRPISVFTQTA